MTGADELRLRPADSSDAELLLSWRNDPSTRAQSLTTNEVDPEEHARWLNRKLAATEGSRIYIAELADGPVGQARVDRRAPGIGEVSVSVDVAARNRGIGQQLIESASIRAAAELGLAKVFALVKERNVASLGAFGAAGYGAERRELRNGEPVVVLAWRAASQVPPRTAAGRDQR